MVHVSVRSRQAARTISRALRRRLHTVQRFESAAARRCGGLPFPAARSCVSSLRIIRDRSSHTYTLRLNTRFPGVFVAPLNTCGDNEFCLEGRSRRIRRTSIPLGIASRTPPKAKAQLAPPHWFKHPFAACAPLLRAARRMNLAAWRTHAHCRANGHGLAHNVQRHIEGERVTHLRCASRATVAKSSAHCEGSAFDRVLPSAPASTYRSHAAHSCSVPSSTERLRSIARKAERYGVGLGALPFRVVACRAVRRPGIHCALGHDALDHPQLIEPLIE